MSFQAAAGEIVGKEKDENFWKSTLPHCCLAMHAVHLKITANGMGSQQDLLIYNGFFPGLLLECPAH